VPCRGDRNPQSEETNQILIINLRQAHIRNVWGGNDVKMTAKIWSGHKLNQLLKYPLY